MAKFWLSIGGAAVSATIDIPSKMKHIKKASRLLKPVRGYTTMFPIFKHFCFFSMNATVLRPEWREPAGARPL